MLSAAGAVLVVLTLGDLPANVATNFGGGGAPDAKARSLDGRGWGRCRWTFALALHLLILGAHRTEPPQRDRVIQCGAKLLPRRLEVQPLHSS